MHATAWLQQHRPPPLPVSGLTAEGQRGNGAAQSLRTVLRHARARRAHRRAAAVAQQPGQPLGATPGAAALPPQGLAAQPTRLQQQLKDIVAIDVECAHFRAPGQWRMVHLPAEVCLVDAQGTTLLRSHCNPRESGPAWSFCRALGRWGFARHSVLGVCCGC
jgi:hypothetical protein